MTRFSSTLALGATLVLGLWATARADGVTIAEVFAGKVVPITITCKDVTAEWQQFSPAVSEEASSLSRLWMGRSSQERKDQFDFVTLFYTRGETLTIAGEPYLVAYRLQFPATTLLVNELIHPIYRDDMSDLVEDLLLINEKTPLHLCLLNQRDAGHLMEVQPAKLSQMLRGVNEITGQMLNRARQTSSMSNIRQIVTALLFYAQDHDENLPKFASSTDFSCLQIPQEILTQPGTTELYRINLALSGKVLGRITNLSTVPALYEAVARPDGRRIVGFIDGHVAPVSASEWGTLQKKWQLESVLAPAPVEAVNVTTETPQE